MDYIACFCNLLTVIKLVLLLEYRIGNKYCTIVWKALIAFSNWGAICHRLYPDMQDLLIALIKRLIKPEILEG